MATAPAVAVVIVTYKSAKDLPTTLEALLPQMTADDELVVVDCASDDDPGAVLERVAPRARLLALSENLGFAGGANAGVAATSAPLVFLLNPDARVAPGALDALRAAASEQPTWGAWQALVTMHEGREVNTSGGVTHWLGFGWAGACGEPLPAVRAPYETSFASGAALIVRREAWTAAGGFDAEYFMYGEDLDLALRLRLMGWGVGVVPTAHVEHDYTFTKGDYKWFHLERNRWWTLLGAYPKPLLALLLPALIVFDVALLAVAARGGWAGAKLRAQVAVLRTLPWALRRRGRVQAQRTASTAQFARGLTSSLDSPYLGKPPRPLLAMQASYWRGVRGLLGGTGV
ncbi:glycosyltransferase family 2 protein [Solirubrobacter phytolaccae]|uniref:Glycosyltransferase family 2 protein n=1 Tax=Solirubrobacter phytolaccae TaxID=1404360 RepID=A0A9X3NED1_9ACTN|nr:glycosyltransferase family 2 protein [Solirubrobacter phytolaccae]MDA0185155.1 glycosyltransferase family 2 protein [Solirubrobacter phytolaccae]